MLLDIPNDYIICYGKQHQLFTIDKNKKSPYGTPASFSCKVGSLDYDLNNSYHVVFFSLCAKDKKCGKKIKQRSQSEHT
jgi:hypothetical protein